MKRVLVVEDSKAEQRLIVGLLQSIGLEVILTDNGQAALKWLRKNGQPDLIITDIIMPNLTGLDLCRQIRNKLNFQEVPIIYCSQKNQKFDQFWALRQGGNAYLVKPYSPTDLLRKVKEFLY